MRLGYLCRAGEILEKKKKCGWFEQDVGTNSVLWCPDLKYHLATGTSVGRVLVVVVVALLFSLRSRQVLAALFPPGLREATLDT